MCLVFPGVKTFIENYKTVGEMMRAAPRDPRFIGCSGSSFVWDGLDGISVLLM